MMKKVTRIKFVEFESGQWRILLSVSEIYILMCSFETFLILDFFLTVFSPKLWKLQILIKCYQGLGIYKAICFDFQCDHGLKP